MSTVPKITETHWLAASKKFTTGHTVMDVCNKAIEIALAEQQESEYITAAQAQHLGFGKVQVRQIGEKYWQGVTDGFYYSPQFEYRAIKQAQPEPVDPQHKQTLITQNELKTLLLYSEETGQFTWRVCSGSKKQGAVAGTLTEKGYVRIKLKGMKYYAHRLAWMYAYGSFPINEIDHVNHCRADNRLSNLRGASRMQNTSNTLQNTSGCVGVHWDNAKQKWRARIQKEGSSICLGTFSDIQDAVNARKQAEDTYYGHNSYPLGNTPATDNHAALRAEYIRQRDAVPCELEFYLWETLCLDGATWDNINDCLGEFFANCQYRYTDISCYVSKDGDTAIRMLRTDSQELQRNLGDTVDWFMPEPNKVGAGLKIAFTLQGTYTYRTKATIKLGGNMVTPEQAAAECLSKKGTHDLYYSSDNTDNGFGFIGALSAIEFNVNSAWNAQYELRPKQPTWTGSRNDAIALLKELGLL